MPISAIAELTLAVREPTVVASFYEEVFALRRLSGERDRIWLAVGDRARLGLWTPGTKEFGDQGGAHVHFAFAVTEGTLDELAARAKRAGGHVTGPVEHSGGDRSLYVEDPAGNLVEAWDLFAGSETVERVRETENA